MRALLLLLFLPLAAQAQTISSANCTPANRTGCVSLYLPNQGNAPTVSVQITGTWVGTILFEGSNTDTAYVPLQARPVDGGAFAPSTTTNGLWQVPAGITFLRVRASAWTSGTATVTMQTSSAPVPTDVVRAVGATSGSLEVTGAVTANLGASSLAAIAAPVCAIPSAPPIVTVTTSATDIPATPLAGRTQLLVFNLSDIQSVWCCKGVGCTPTATAAYIIGPGGSQTFPARATDIIRCRSALATAAVNAQEASCG